jgi:PAS domain S-box-containing protein
MLADPERVSSGALAAAVPGDSAASADVRSAREANFKPDRFVKIVFAAAIAVLILIGVLSYRSTLVSSESDAWVRHTNIVSANLESMLYSLTAIEASSASYILTGDDSYLAAWRASGASLKVRAANVRQLTQDNPIEQARLPAIDALIAQRVEVASRIIALRRDRGLEAAAAEIRTGTLRNESVEFRGQVQRMLDEEAGLLVRRTATWRSNVQTTRMELVLGMALGLLITAAAWYGVVRDSSRRRRAENSLRISEDQYRTLLNEARDYAISMLDQNGKVITWNSGAERIKGYTSAQIIGSHFSRFFSREDIDRGRPEQILKATIAEGRHEDQGRRVRRDGSQFVSSTTYTALRDPSGSLRGFSAITRDLSETKESGAKYRGLMEAAPDAMVVVNQGGEIVLLNLQAESQFGYHRDELIGQKVTSIVPVGFAERLVADGLRSADEALAQQIGTGIELTARRKDGTEFPIEIMLSPLRSPDGILITAAIRDISVRKAAETYLVQMESRYRGLLEAAPDAMLVVNQGGEIVLLNLQAEKKFGYRRDELLGQMVTNIIPVGFAERLIADGLRSAEEALAQQIGTGIELTARRKDGSEFPMELMLSPLGSEDGILVTAAIRDISVRKAAETHLAQMESRYRGLLEAAPDAMVVVNQRGEIVLLNLQAEKQFGYQRDELLGQKVTNIIPEGFAERLIADGLRSAEEALAQHIGTGIELTARRKDGSEFPMELMLSPLGSADGILVTVAIRDITMRRTAEQLLLQKVEELNRSNEELQQFAYIASHDLQEPLRMVASYTTLIARRYKGKLDADADDFIAFAVDGAKRMQRLIQDLLIYSRVGSKGGELFPTSSDDALEQAVRNLRGALEESGGMVTHDALPVVMADELQLVQLFQNLVGNAIKYRRSEAPIVHIGAILCGAKKWLFSVRDNGLGIEPQYFERIFGMFQRLHKREEFAGTGIGLAICKKIVERHGGGISVESVIGEGSTFHFQMANAEERTCVQPL